MPIATATSASRIPSAPASPTTRSSITSCPKMIRYYLERGSDPAERADLPRLGEGRPRLTSSNTSPELVIKAANESGGYGMLDRPAGDESGVRRVPRNRCKQNPRNYIAQPIVPLSRAPAFCDDAMQGRHVDLRPYILYGEKVTIIPGGSDARGAARGFARGQFLARRRKQGHLGGGWRSGTSADETTTKIRSLTAMPQLCLAASPIPFIG